ENETPEHRKARLVKESAAGSSHEAAETTAAAAMIYKATVTTATAATIYEAITAAESRYAGAGLRHFRVVISECRSPI
ncbi:9395_t:CDS:2, partial [Funneliformis caledonium]